MYFIEKQLDDLLIRLLKKLLLKKQIVITSRGNTKELCGVLLCLDNPRARLSWTETKGTLFSCFGELLWYLSGSDKLEQIKYYIKDYDINSDDGKTIYGAYGPRFFRKNDKINQIDNITRILKNNSNSRKAVIQLFDANDLVNKHLDIPCTCTLQFLIRNGKLHLFVSMRSNDAFIGLPHDVFAFTFIQEIISRKLDVEVGTYKHFVGSLHLYESNFEKAQEYIHEGWQTSTQMPVMPNKNPDESIKIILDSEKKIREGEQIEVKNLNLNEYWKDIVRILIIFSFSKSNKITEISKIASEMTNDVYKTFIKRKRNRIIKKNSENQLNLEL